MNGVSIMKRTSALMIGNSSTVIYLGYALCNSDCELTLYPFTQTHQFAPESSWTIHGTNAYEYKPHRVICSMEQLNNSLQASEEAYFRYDYIIFDTKFIDVLRQIPILFNRVLKPDSIIVHITDGYCPLLPLDNVFANYCVLTMISNVDCRLVDASTNSYVLMSTHQEIMVGSVCSNPYRATTVALKLQEGVGKRLEWIKAAYEWLGHVMVLVLRNNRPLLDAIRRKTVAIICLESLSVTFNEPEIIELVRKDSVVPVLDGVYRELIAISKELYKSSYYHEKPQILQLLIGQESRAQAERMSLLLQKPYLPKHTSANLLYYNFRQGYEMTNILLIQNVIKHGAALAMKLPFVDSIYRFLIKVAAIARGKGDRNLLKLRDVNGIPPERNIMNYPPFQPLPNPTPPKIIKEKPEEVVDALLQELMVGREELTYGVYDADHIKNTEIFEMEPTQPKSPKVQLASPPLLPLAVYPPAYPTQVRDSQGNSFILHPNGVITPIESQPLSPPPPPPPKPFSHVALASNRNTSSQRLRQSQANLLNVVHFQGIIEMSSSRYGDLDSSTSLVNNSTKTLHNSSDNSAINSVKYGTSSNSSYSSVSKK